MPKKPIPAPAIAFETTATARLRNGAELRRWADPAAEIICAVPAGCLALLLREKDGWAEIVWNGLPGFVPADEIETEA